jgi:hypothetical protein
MRRAFAPYLHATQLKLLRTPALCSAQPVLSKERTEERAAFRSSPTICSAAPTPLPQLRKINCTFANNISTVYSSSESISSFENGKIKR